MPRRMSATRHAVAVVGLGAMGAATLYQLARRGVPAIGIDRFHPPHTMGSSHGETRITRVAVGEGEAYVPFVRRSHEIWRELEAATGQELLNQCGLLMMAPRGVRTGHHGKTDFLNRTATVARTHAIPHERLEADAIAARFPAFLLDGTEEGYFEPSGGFVHPERCIAAQLHEARRLGATVLTGRTVHSMERDGAGMAVRTHDGTAVHTNDGTAVHTNYGTIHADQVVVSAGAWTGAMLGAPFQPVLVPRRQVLHWLPLADAAPFAPARCPAYIWMHGASPEDYFYGFPALPGSNEVKVASEQYALESDPDRLDRTVLPEEAEAMSAAHTHGRLRGAGHPSRGAVCMYTVTPDAGFVIDRHPVHDRVVVVSACSGHGFKHSAGIGESVAQLVCEGRSRIDLAPFRFGRLDARQAA